MITKEYVRQMREKDREMRKMHPEYPPPDEVDALEEKYLSDEIGPYEYEVELNRLLSETKRWFTKAREDIDEVFKPYLQETT